MEATCTNRSESPTSGRLLTRAAGNQLTTGEHCVSVDESELRKRSSVDVSQRHARSARVGGSDQFGSSKRRSTSLAGDDRSPPTKRRDEHDSEDDGEAAPSDDTSGSGAATR